MTSRMLETPVKYIIMRIPTGYRLGTLNIISAAVKMNFTCGRILAEPKCLNAKRPALSALEISVSDGAGMGDDIADVGNTG